MSERITEADLAKLEASIRHDWSPGLPVPVEDGWPLRLVDEVRRLRAVIEKADDQAQSFIAGSQDALESNADLDTRRVAFEAVQDAHDPGQPWAEFVAEARAIREEQGRG